MVEEEPKLAPPGAGLSLVPHLLLNYWLYPRSMAKFSWQRSLEKLQRETARIAALAAPLTEEQFYKRVLIKPLWGIEDSSRFWSVGMTIEHLVIVMRNMAAVVESLSRGVVPDAAADVAKVKPHKDIAPSKEARLAEFQKTMEDAVALLAPLEGKAPPDKKYRHPFLGPIPAEGWVWSLCSHQGLHRLQAERIIEGLNLK